CQQYSDLLFSF
nr:immunoglobulin light chain junction region [Macaca mulatta]MOY00874.1 immunoglobulin light chain junction region [Macaca mulatta]MOY01592.1 immunoglobulin light chain junction region [Macaca mulatta]MOY02195.1 immunoglobulin light chain junction region [Macaca mulatta]MOY03423.1 immunoglobulin light chain junction region [Macaca mulatta]